VVSLVASPAFAGITFETSSIARVSDPAPVPPQLVQVSSPSVADGGQVAFVGDGGIFLQTKDGTTLVVAPGDPAPGGGKFFSVWMPLVNELGDVAFIAGVSSPGRPGIFLWSNGSISPIVQADDPAPSGGVFLSFSELGMKGGGEDLTIAFSGSSYNSITEKGLFLFSHGAFQRLVRQGDMAPGGGTFVNLSYPSVNLSGQVAFYGYLNPPTDGIFLVQPDGRITEVARNGDSAPEGGTFEFAADGTASYVSISLPSLNENGELAFSAHTSIFGRGGIFLYSDGQTSRRIRELDPAPGGGVFYALTDPTLNSGGQIAFYGSTSIVTGFFLFSPETGIVELVHRGQESPEGDTFSGFYTLADLNASGQVAFAGLLTKNLGGVYLASPGEIDRIAGQGDPVDRDPIFADVHHIAINSAGQVLFMASAFPGGVGLFVGAPPAPVVRVGDSAPGGGVFEYIYPNRAAMNDERIVFVAASTSDFNTTVYSFSDGAFSQIARSGDPAPGGGTFYYFGSLALNKNGDLVLLGYANSPNRTGLYILSGGVFSSVLTVGDPAPDGGTFSSFDYFSFNDLNQIAFLGSVTPPGRSGIFRWSDGVAKPIARTGDSAPGGGTYTFTSASPIFAPSLNAHGDLAFAAPLSTNHAGVFKFSDEIITRVAGEGDPAPGGGTILLADNAWLNDPGQVAFYAATSSTVGVFLLSEGRVSAVARGGDPAPGGGTFIYVDVPRLNGQTQVGFLGSLPDGYGAFEATPTN
jgi:hypothetical protein